MDDKFITIDDTFPNESLAGVGVEDDSPTFEGIPEEDLALEGVEEGTSSDLGDDEEVEVEEPIVDGRELLRKEMDTALRSGSAIGKELQSTFSEEERITSVLNLKSDSFSIELGTVNLMELSPTVPLKESRRQTYKGLTQTVKELGILTPIHVMYTESYKRYLDKGDFSTPWSKEEDGDKYILIDGFRRVWAGLTNKLSDAPAVIWSFDDMDLAMEMLTPLSLLLNKSQKHDWKEIWGLYQILESTSLMTPSTLEYLLQLDAGDAMKLKDVVLAEYPEIKEELFAGTKTLQQCYNNLQKMRKEEDRLDVEDQKGLSDIEGADEVVGDVTEGEGQLSKEEVKKILEFDESDIENISDDEFIELAGKEDDGVSIDRRQGEDIPKELKQAALARDNYSCQVSHTGLDSGLKMTMAMAVLQVHHIIPLYLGGKNTLDNLVTLRMDIHTWVHVIERLGGKIGMSPDEFRQLDEVEKRDLFGALRYAKVIVDEAKRQGKSIVDKSLQDASRRASSFKMPGTDLKENMDAIGSGSSED